MMVQTVLPIVGSRDIAEDIVADTFLILLAKINSVMEHEQPVKWLFRVLKNNAISEYRAQCRHAVFADGVVFQRSEEHTSELQSP